MTNKRAVMGPPMEDARAIMRHRSLVQDFQDLVKETEAKKKRLLNVKAKKLKLLREVKFLRRKLKSFSENNSLEQSSDREVSARTNYVHMQNSGFPSEAHVEVMNHEEAEATTKGKSALLDLSQVSDRPATSTPQAARYMQVYNSGLPSKANLEERKPTVKNAAIHGTSGSLYLNQVSYVPSSLSGGFAHMHDSGLQGSTYLKVKNEKMREARTADTTLLDLNPVSYRRSPPYARYPQIHNSVLPSRSPPEYQNHRFSDVATRGTTTLLDLNQDVEEFEEEDPPRIDVMNRFLVAGSTTANDQKLLCRGDGNEPNQVRRMKLPLPDQFPLRV